MRTVLGLAFLAVAASAVADDKPRLVLDAPRVQMILPGLAAKGYGKSVEVTARFEGDTEDPETLLLPRRDLGLGRRNGVGPRERTATPTMRARKSSETSRTLITTGLATSRSPSGSTAGTRPSSRG